MFSSIKNMKQCPSFKIIAFALIFAYLGDFVVGPNPAQAQMMQPVPVLNLPAAGSMVPLSKPFSPMMIEGITVYPENPLQFDFIVDRGDENFDTDEDYYDNAQRLMKYFLASLTVPEDELWVNLSPHEKNRIIPQSFGLTEMGRDVLAQDYILKQVTASLMYPEEDVGKKLWDKIYARMDAKFQNRQVALNTFNKVWIVPEKAVVFQKGTNAFVVESKLKVMLDQDYLALQEHRKKHGLDAAFINDKEFNDEFADIVREVMIPEIEHEVNYGENFAPIRQIFQALILADWYKKNLRETLLGQIYVDKNKIAGVDVADKMIKEKIYQQYMEAFKQGVFNYIKEDYDPNLKDIVPRQYFSGGLELSLGNVDAKTVDDEAMLTSDQREKLIEKLGADQLKVNLVEFTQKNRDRAKEIVFESRERLDEGAQRMRQMWQRVPKKAFGLGLFVGVLAAVGLMSPDMASTVVVDGQNVQMAGLGFFGFFGSALGRVGQDLPLRYKRIVTESRLDGWKSILRATVIAGIAVVYISYLAVSVFGRLQPKTPPITQDIVATTVYEDMQSLLDPTVTMPDGTTHSPTLEEKEALKQAYYEWQTLFREHGLVERDMEFNPDGNVKSPALDYIRMIKKYLPGDPDMLDQIIAQTGESPTVATSAAKLIGKMAETAATESEDIDIADPQQFLESLKELTEDPDVQSSLHQIDDIIQGHQSDLMQMIESGNFEQFSESEVVKRMYDVIEQNPKLREASKVALVQAGIFTGDLGIFNKIPPQFLVLPLILAGVLLIPSIEARRRLTTDEATGMQRWIYHSLAALTLTSVAWGAWMMANRGVAQFLNDPVRTYYEVENGQLKPPADGQVFVEDLIYTVRQETLYYNTAAAFYINNIVRPEANNESFYRLAEHFDSNTNHISDADLNNIIKVMLRDPETRKRFYDFWQEDAGWINGLIGRSSNGLNLEILQQLEMPIKRAILTRFISFIINQNFNDYDDAQQRAVLQLLWTMRAEPYQSPELMKKHPLWESVKEQFVHTEFFADDNVFTDKISQSLQDGSYRLIKLPADSNEFYHQTMTKIFGLSNFVYEVPEISLSSRVITVLTGQKIDEVEGLKNTRFVVVDASVKDLSEWNAHFYSSTGKDAVSTLAQEAQIKYWEMLQAINQFEISSLEEVSLNNRDQSMLSLAALSIPLAIGGGSLSLLWMWNAAKSKRRKFEDEQIALRTGSRERVQYEGRLGTIIAFITVLAAVSSSVTFHNNRQKQRELDVSLVPDAAYYEEVTPDVFVDAILDPYVLDEKIKLTSATPGPFLGAAAELADFRLVGQLEKLRYHQDEEVRKRAEEALDAIRMNLQRSFQEHLQRLKGIMASPEYAHLRTDKNLKRFHDLFVKLVNQNFASMDDAAFKSLVDLYANANPEHISDLLVALGVDSTQGEAFVQNLWTVLQENPETEENNFKLGLKYLLDSKDARAVLSVLQRKMSPVPIGRNQDIREALEASSVGTRDDFQQAMQEEDTKKGEVIATYLLTLFVGVMVYQSWLMRQANSKEGQLTVVRFNTPATKRSRFWQSIVALNEAQDDPDVTTTLLDTYQALTKDEESLTKAKKAAVKRVKKFEGTLTERAMKREEAKAQKSNNRIEKDLTIVIDQKEAVAQALKDRFVKGTTTWEGFERAFKEITEQFPGYTDAFFEMISSIDFSDITPNRLVPMYEKILLPGLKKAKGDVSKLMKFDDRFALLLGVVAAKALRDINTEDSRVVLQKLKDVEEKILDHVIDLGEEESNGLPRWQRREQMGLDRVFVEKFNLVEGVKASSRGMYRIDRLAGGNTYKPDQFVRYMLMQANIALGLTQATEGLQENGVNSSREENTDGDQAMLTGGWMRKIILPSLLIPVFLNITGCDKDEEALAAFYKDPPKITNNHIAFLADNLRAKVGDDQAAAKMILDLMQWVAANPDIISQAGLEVAPVLVDVASYGPETAIAADQALNLIWNQLERSDQKKMDEKILPNLLNLVGHPNEQVAFVVQKWLMNSKASDVNDNLLLLLESSDPHQSAGAVGILGRRKHNPEAIYRFAKKAETMMEIEAALDALRFASGKISFYRNKDGRILAEMMRSFGHVPDNAFSRIDYQEGAKGSKQDRDFYSLELRGTGGVEYENRWYTEEQITIEYIFGQPIEVITEVDYQDWGEIRGAAIRMPLDDGAYRFLFQLIRNPFEDQAEQYLAKLATTSENPEVRIAAIKQLAELDKSKLAVSTMFHLMQDTDPKVAWSAFDGLRSFSNKTLVHKMLKKTESDVSPGILKQFADTTFGVFFEAFGMYAQRNLMGVYGARHEDLYEGIDNAGEFLDRVNNRGENMFTAASKTGAQHWLSEHIADFMMELPSGLRIPIDFFGAEMAVEYRDAQIEKYLTRRDPTVMYRYMAFLFSTMGEEKDAPVLLGMLKMDDPMTQGFARDGLSRLGYEFNIKRLTKQLDSSNIKKASHAAFVLGAAGTAQAVRALEEKFFNSDNYTLRKDIISGLAYVVRNGEAKEEAANVLVSISERLLDEDNPETFGLRKFFADHMINLSQIVDTSSLKAQIDRAFATAMTPYTSQQNDKRLDDILVSGRLINLSLWNGKAEDVEAVAQALEGSLKDLDVYAIDRQLIYVQALTQMGEQQQQWGEVSTTLIDSLKLAITHGIFEVSFEAMKSLSKFSPETFISLFPPSFYRVADYNDDAIRTIKLWNTQRVFLNRQGNPIDFDALVQSAQTATMVPYDLIWAARNGWLLDLQIEAMEALASLKNEQAETALIGIIEDDESALSGYAARMLLKRSARTAQEATLNRMGAAVSRAVEHEYWTTRWQVMAELYSYIHGLVQELESLEHGKSDLPNNVAMKKAQQIRSRLETYWEIFYERLEERMEPESEGVIAIRQLASRILVDMEKGGGMRMSQRVKDNLDLGRISFKSMAEDPKFIIAEEDVVDLKRDMLSQAFLTAAVNNTAILSQASVLEMLSHQDPHVRLDYVYALYLSGPWNQEVKELMLDNLVDENFTVMQIKKEALLEKGVSAHVIKQAMIDILKKTEDYSFEQVKNAVFILVELIDDGDIPQDDISVFFALNQLRKHESVEIRGRAVRGLNQVNFSDETLKNFTPQQIEEVRRDFQGITNFSDPIIVEGNVRIAEVEALKALLPYDMVEESQNRPSMRVFESGVDFLFTVLNIYGQQDRRSQQNIVYHMQSENPLERRMAYEMVRDQLRVVPQSVTENMDLIAALVEKAGVENDQWGRQELFETLSVSRLRTNWTALTTEFSEQGFVAFYHDYLAALEKATAIEWSVLVSMTGKEALDDFGGIIHKSSTFADLYLTILQSHVRRGYLNRSGDLEGLIGKAEAAIQEFEDLQYSYNSSAGRLFWAQRIKTMREKLGAIRTQVQREKSRERYQSNQAGDEAMLGEDLGGIDLRPEGFETQILRDDSGIPLPLPQQPLTIQMDIEGFIPVIIQRVPVVVPQLLGLKHNQDPNKTQQAQGDVHDSDNIYAEKKDQYIYGKREMAAILN